MKRLRFGQVALLHLARATTQRTIVMIHCFVAAAGIFCFDAIFCEVHLAAAVLLCHCAIRHADDLSAKNKLRARGTIASGARRDCFCSLNPDRRCVALSSPHFRSTAASRVCLASGNSARTAQRVRCDLSYISFERDWHAPSPLACWWNFVNSRRNETIRSYCDVTLSLTTHLIHGYTKK